VPLVENKVHQNVHVHQVKLILTDIANHVTINVKNVVKLLLNVNLVLILELMLQIVFVQKDIMMMVIILNVSNVHIIV